MATISKTNLGVVGNQEHEKEIMGLGVTNTTTNAAKPTAIEIFRKLNRLPIGSMIGMHQVDHLEEQEKTRSSYHWWCTKGLKNSLTHGLASREMDLVQ